jgi:hypothetical protein
MVIQKGVDHFFCVVHKYFYVAIPRPDEETEEEWLGTSVNIGDQVTFRVLVVDFTSNVPHIQGKLFSFRYAFVL